MNLGIQFSLIFLYEGLVFSFDVGSRYISHASFDNIITDSSAEQQGLLTVLFAVVWLLKCHGPQVTQ